jgi:phage recombination protein Bet
MNQQITTAEQPKKSVLLAMANKFEMEAKMFESTVKQTVMPNKGQNVSNEEFASFLLVAKEYNLNPLVKEIYAFPSKAGGIQPIVSIDGWVRIINEHPQFDGMEFNDILTQNGELRAIECKIFRKDRSHPVVVTEYMDECKNNKEPWQKWPARMLRHKALIQCARYAFGFSGIVDPDEGERMRDVTPENTKRAEEVSKAFDKSKDNIIEVEEVAPKEEDKLDELLKETKNKPKAQPSFIPEEDK